MSALQTYLDNINNWTSIFGEAPIAFPRTKAEAQPIIDRLECDLSPENLHCDGEISVAEANRKYNFYMRVEKELNKIA